MRQGNLQNLVACVNISKRLNRSSQYSIFTNWKILTLVYPTQQQSGASSKQTNCHHIFISQGLRQDKLLSNCLCVWSSCGRKSVFWRSEMGGILTSWSKSLGMFQFSDDIQRKKWEQIFTYVSLHQGRKGMYSQGRLKTVFEIVNHFWAPKNWHPNFDRSTNDLILILFNSCQMDLNNKTQI